MPQKLRFFSQNRPEMHVFYQKLAPKTLKKDLISAKNT
jgi:hypothetical protein